MVTSAQQARPAPPVLRVRGLSVTFGPFAALQGVDLDVEAGEIVGIAGDNGAGKTTLLRCIDGDLGQAAGGVWLDGEPMPCRPSSHPRDPIGVVWQHLVLSDNLDVAASLMLGKERRRVLTSQSRMHASARLVLDDLGIAITDTTRLVRTLTAAERQLLAIARAASPRPRLLLLDEPTAVLSRADSAQVELLISRFRDEGTTIVLVSHDVEQLFRLAHRVVVLRHGRVVAQVDPSRSHPDELLALMAGHDASSAPRRQLSRLHGLTDQLASADSAGSLALILSTLGAALGTQQLSLHLLDETMLRSVASVGLPAALEDAWRSVPLYTAGGPPSMAVLARSTVVEEDVRTSPALRPYLRLLDEAGIAGWWAVPFSGGHDLTGAISVYRPDVGAPGRDEIDLVNLYAGYAATTLERERLVAELTARNKVLETIRAVLQTLAGPDSLTDGIRTVLETVREAVTADAIALYERTSEKVTSCRAYAVRSGAVFPSQLGDDAGLALQTPGEDERALERPLPGGDGSLLVRLSDTLLLAAGWHSHLADAAERVLLEDAGHSILLALERERAEEARRETSALRRSQEMQRQFLARLSHELRTPLTAIRGYASSLMQTDVTWDEASQQRFLGRISSESARLRRLVDDLLDFSMIESGMLRLRPDWVDLPLVIDAARSCLSPQSAAVIEIDCARGIPAIWADHDRLEQMMMNLMDNAVRHNPPGTLVGVRARPDGADAVLIEVSDNGTGFAQPAGDEPASARRSPTAGAGLGLSITQGIVEAHHGIIRHGLADPGTRFTIRLPVEADALRAEAVDV